MRYLVLGPVEVAAGDRTVPLGPPKQRVLFATLSAQCGRVVSTAQIIDALWLDDPPATAENLVQGYVGGLRRTLGGEAVVTRAPGYELVAPSDGLDSADVEAEYRAGSAVAAGGALEEGRERLNAALDLWRGPAYADVAEEAGVHPEAIRLEEMRARCIEERVGVDLALGRHADVVAELEALVEERPLQERLWEELALALYRSGRQADALRRLAELRRRLVEELGISPSAAIQDLERRILDQDPRLDLVPADGPVLTRPRPTGPDSAPPTQAGRWPRGLKRPAGPARRPALPTALAGEDGPFVGRADELARVEERWHTARTEGQQAVVIAGEPGIGKTRFAGEVARMAVNDGAAVLFGRCDPDVLSPFQPFVEAVRDHLDAVAPDALASLTGAHAAELGRLVPGLAARLPEPPDGRAARGDPTMLWLVDGLADLLAGLASERGALLVVEDLHWADSTTVALLRHLLRRHRESPTLVLATYRDTDLSADHPLIDLLVELHGDAACERLELGGLHRREIEALLTGHDSDRSAVADVLARETAGNPLFVAELLRYREQTGALGVDTFDDGVLGVPLAIAELTALRLRRLSRDARSVIRAAAVFGDRFALPAVREALAGGDAVDVLSALEEAVAIGLVVEQPEAPGAFAFRHELVRRAVYESVSVVRRQELHARAAAALTAVGGRDDTVLLRVARHYRLAGTAVDPATAVESFLAAAEVASRGWAKAEAADLYGAALEALPPDDEPRRRFAYAQRYVNLQAAWHGVYDETSIRAASQRGDRRPGSAGAGGSSPVR